MFQENRLTERSLPFWSQFLGSILQLSWPRSGKALLCQILEQVGKKSLAISLPEMELPVVLIMLKPIGVDEVAVPSLQHSDATSVGERSLLRVQEPRHGLWSLRVKGDVDQANLEYYLQSCGSLFTSPSVVWGSASCADIVENVGTTCTSDSCSLTEIGDDPLVILALDLLETVRVAIKDCIGVC